jgi:hypothetical protein
MTVLRAQARGLTIPDVEMVFQGTDGAQSTVEEAYLWDDPGPLFSNTKCGKDGSVSFPMGFHDQFGAFYGDMGLEEYAAKLGKFHEMQNLSTVPWEEKEAQLFFSSGASRGAGVRGHRGALYTIESPLFNVVDQNVPLEEYAKYRYQVYAYGRCGWSRRIRELAFIKGVIFAENSSCREYFFDEFRPGKDFVPVAEDFSNLEAKVTQVHKDAKAAERLASNWVDRASNVFALPCVLDYIWDLLVEYERLQRFKPKPRPTWPIYDFRNETIKAAHTHFFQQDLSLDNTLCKEPRKKGNGVLTC